jgi:CubicO group peptidase (beta-lactamase class C family)
MMRFSPISSVTAVALLCAVALVFSPTQLLGLEIDKPLTEKDKVAALDEWLQRLHDANEFNGAVLLAKHGRVLFSESYGYHSLEETNPLTERSSFNLASVSKPITAMGIVILQYQSKLEYDNEVSDLIPELAFYEGITIRHLLHHTSGLPDYMQLALDHEVAGDVFTTADMLELFGMLQPPVEFDAGEAYEYSNTGYVLLAEIIERASGQTFQDFMWRNIFEPLSMEDTQVFNLVSESEPENRVYGYENRRTLFGFKKVPHDLDFLDGVAGDGGIYSSAYDLFRWHKGIIDGDLVPTDTYNIAYRSGRLNDGTETGYGFGWVIGSNQTVEHSGGWQGFNTYLYRNYEEDELIIVLDSSSNTSIVDPEGSLEDSITPNLQKFMDSLASE